MGVSNARTARTHSSFRLIRGFTLSEQFGVAKILLAFTVPSRHVKAA
jgi:hypothetical protein